MPQQSPYWMYLKEMKYLCYDGRPIRYSERKKSVGCLSSCEWTKKMYYIYTMVYHPIKKDDIFSLVKI